MDASATAEPAAVEPPEGLGRIATSEPDRLAMPSNRYAWGWIRIGAGAGALAGVVWLAMIAWLFAQSGEVDDRLLGPMLLGLPGLLGGVLLGAVIGWARATTRHRLVVTPHRIAFEGFEPPADLAPGPVKVDGRPGEIQRISIGDEVVAELAPGTRMWTFEQATWAARRIADLTGQPFVDARDRELWARWQEEPAFRAEERWDRELDGNRRAFPLDHAIRPEPPDSHVMDLDGLKLHLPSGSGQDEFIGISQTHLHLREASVPLRSIQRVAVFFEWSRQRVKVVRLVLLVHERSVVLATEVSDDLTASRFLWVAQEIERFRQLAPDAHTDRGTAAEIPPELQRLAARRSREG